MLGRKIAPCQRAGRASGVSAGTRIAFLTLAAATSCAAALALQTTPGLAHGFAGNRFFPATLATDDPFVADELSLPTITHQKVHGDDGAPDEVDTTFAVDFTRRVLPDFGISFGGAYKIVRPNGLPEQHGFDNFSTGAKWQFYKNDARELIMSTGVDVDIGSSGNKRVGAENFTTFTPAFFFGKGMGDLPDSMGWLKPVAITGTLGVGVPSEPKTQTVDGDDVDTDHHPVNFVWGFAVEYSIPYLQSFVQDVGLREPFNRLIPVVEFNFNTPINRTEQGTTGTINPGIIWAGQKIQLSVEAIIPVNHQTAPNYGVIGQVHFYLDDLIPSIFGHPIFQY